MLDYLIFAVTFVITLVITVIYLYPGSKKPTTAPGPEPIDPLEGNIPDITSSGGLHHFLCDIHQTYQDVSSFWLGTQLCVSVASPDHFSNLTGSSHRPECLYEVLKLLSEEHHPLLMNGKTAVRRSEKMRRMMERDDFVEQVVEENLETIKTSVESHVTGSPEQHVALYERCSTLVLKIITNSFITPSFITEAFEMDGGGGSGGGGGGGSGGGGGKNKIIDVTSLKNYLDHTWAEIDHFLVNSQDVDGRREERINKYRTSILHFISNHLQQQHLQSSDYAQKWAEPLLPIICDSYYKLSAFFTWFGVYIAKDMTTQKKLREELETSSSHLASLYTLPLTFSVAAEVLRCSNIVTHTSRSCAHETIFGGHRVPPNTPIIQATGVVNQCEDFFQDAFSFRPGRTQPSSSVPSFGIGSRKCPASKLSRALVVCFYFFLLSRFSFTLVSSVKKVDEEDGGGDRKVRRRNKGEAKKGDEVGKDDEGVVEDGVVGSGDGVVNDVDIEPDITPHYGFYTRPKEEVWLTFKKL